MILATIAAIVVSQAPAGWTQEQLNGIYQALAQVQQQVNAGTKPTKMRPTKISWGGNVGKGKACMVCTGWYVEPALAVKLGIDPALYLDAQGQPVTAKLYATITVCAGPNANRADKPSWLRFAITETCSAPVLSDPGQDAFQVALVGDTEVQSAATGPACVCRSGPSCSWTRPTIGGGFTSGPCPAGLTMPASQVTGTDVVRKTCIEWAGTNSLPDACR